MGICINPELPMHCCPETLDIKSYVHVIALTFRTLQTGTQLRRFTVEIRRGVVATQASSAKTDTRKSPCIYSSSV